MAQFIDFVKKLKEAFVSKGLYVNFEKKQLLSVEALHKNVYV